MLKWKFGAYPKMVSTEGIMKISLEYNAKGALTFMHYREHDICNPLIDKNIPSAADPCEANNFPPAIEQFSR